jgi:hypothetical protein
MQTGERQMAQCNAWQILTTSDRHMVAWYGQTQNGCVQTAMGCTIWATCSTQREKSQFTGAGLLEACIKSLFTILTIIWIYIYIYIYTYIIRRLLLVWLLLYHILSYSFGSIFISVYIYIYMCVCMFCMLLFNFVNHVFLFLCMFRSVYSVSLCCSVYCLCVNVYCTTATGCQPNCS